MPANYRAELVGVLGQPVAENPTGVMQEAAFAAASLNWRYLTIEVAPENLEDAITGVRAFGMRGINLTIPHKVAVIPYLDGISEEARIIGAVNTVRREGDRLIGENTDGKGFLRGLRDDAGIDPRGKRVLMFGAGGAARAIGAELALAGAAAITVVNRSAARGEEMAAHVHGSTGCSIGIAAWETTWRVGEEEDIIVNATSIGLYPAVEAMPDVDLSAANQSALVADVVFNPPATALLRAAQARGLRTLDGLSMLVYQGAIGFEMWTGMPAPVAVMKRALAASLGAAA